MRPFFWRTILSVLLVTLISFSQVVSAVAGQLTLLKRDPFLPPALIPEAVVGNANRKVTPERELKLRGVLYDGKDFIINLNGVLLKRGQFFGDYKLLEVEGKKAVLQKKDGQRLVVQMENEEKRGN